MDIGVTVGDNPDRIDRIGDAFEFVELGIGEAAALPGELSPTEVRERTATVECGTAVHLPFKQELVTPVPELNEAITAYLARLLEWAGEIDARYAVVHATARNPSDTSLRPLAAEQLAAIDEAADAHDVTVTVENVGHQTKGFPLSVVAEIASEAAVPLCFDVGHAFMEGDEALERGLTRHAEQIAYLHVHDVRERGDTHLPIGAGEVDFGLLADQWDALDADIALEIFTDDRGHLLDSADRVRTLLAADG